MNHLGNNNHLPQSRMDQISPIEILRALNRRKKILFLFIFAMVTIAVLYNFLATPIYEATTTIKKEGIYDKQSTDQLRNIIAMQGTDEIDTEMEIIKTGTVLEKVVNALSLNFIVETLDLAGGNSVKVSKYLCDYEDLRLKTKQNRKTFPWFQEVNLTPGFNENRYYVEFVTGDLFKLYESDTDYLVQSVNASSVTEFNLPNAHIAFKWPNAKDGSRLYFDIQNLEKTVLNLKENVSVVRVGETNIFKITVSSESPTSAQLIANTIVVEFRAARLEQKRQTIRYSYNFIDEQIEGISAKLKNAETELHEFKSKNQIVSIDESSKEAIQFLSNLNAEKVKTDLELAEYQNKLDAMKRELEEKGFFDQTYLTPEDVRNNQTPFSALLEQLSNAELERLELLQKRTENHPEVIAINDKIDQIKEKLSSYNENTITAYQIKIAALEDKQTNLAGLMKKYSNIIKGLPGSETKLAELMREKNVYDKILTLLLDKREEMRMAELSQLQDFVIIDSAQKPLSPVSPHKKLNILVGGFLGLLIGLVVIFTESILGKKVKSVEEIVEHYKIPLLTVIPKYNKDLQRIMQMGTSKEDYLVNLMEGQHGYRESYNLLRTKLMYFIPKSKKILMITSCEENAGKTSVTANLAISLARMNKKVLIIDCDMRKSEMGIYFDVVSKNSRFTISGLGDYLSSRSKPNIYQPFNSSENSELSVSILPAGIFREDSSELLASLKMKRLITDMKKSYDYVLIDTPPITKTVDAFVLGDFIKDVILVIRQNHTFRENVAWAIHELDQAGMNILGVVANACELSTSAYKNRYDYGYGGEYGYGYGKELSSTNL